MSKKTMEKMAKNVHKKTVTIVAIFFIIGLALGFGAYKFMTKDDCFKLIGEKTVTINIEQNPDARYNASNDEGVLAIAFGKDITKEVTVDYSGVDYTTPGEYYVLYTVNSPIYEKYTLYRTIILIDNSMLTP